MSVQYSETFYEGITLSKAATVYLRHLPRNVGGLLTQGTSGCAIASAMLAKSKRKLIHVSVRKDEESSHQAGYAGKVENVKYAIVDDFMDTGRTVRRLELWANSRSLTVVAVLVGHRPQYGAKGVDSCPVIELDSYIER